jgi:NAD(P)-dependent dehydrogenase (short-subunit alcohol dehydrogenase family)
MAKRATPCHERSMLGTRRTVPMLDSTHVPLRTAIVTGASRGLGLGIAHSLAVDHRMRVAMVARDGVALDAAVARVRAAGGEAQAIVADVADKLAIHRIFGIAAATLGDIDVLVNNASALGRSRSSSAIARTNSATSRCCCPPRRAWSRASKVTRGKCPRGEGRTVAR